MRYLLIGLGVSGEATARALLARGHDVVVVEDRPSASSRDRASRLAGAVVHDGPSDDELRRLVAASDALVPSPGVGSDHRAYALAREAGVEIVGEIELASQWTEIPIVAITGTNGKTTVTTLVTAMLGASGVRAVSAGNIGTPLSDAVAGDADVFVVEVSSFQLGLTHTFRPRVAVWLNIGEDHTREHLSFDAYVDSKARIWANQRDDDVAVVNADDPVVMARAASAPGRVASFGVTAAADWRVDQGEIVGPGLGPIARIDTLERALPHDVANALAASAAAIAAGATLDGVRAALAAHRTLPHRLTLVEDAGGVAWYDDSKATNPHAVLAAVAGFESVVLIAGGDAKGVDLTPLAATTDRVHAVVAIGTAAPDVAAVFADRVPVRAAATIDDAVAMAAEFARPGDAVLLSPACASWDMFDNYAHRGDEFARAVRALLAAG